MTATIRTQKKYDHRLRHLVRSTGDIGYATRQGVPRSTARGWLNSDRIDEVMTADVVNLDTLQLQQQILVLRRKIERLTALLRIFVALLKVFRFSLADTRIPDGPGKLWLLRAVERSRSVLKLRTVLRIVQLSHARYHSWQRQEPCGFADVPSCPQSSPQQLTRAEVDTIKGMVTSAEYRHVPTGTLALLAQRLGRVFASPATWYRLVHHYKWRRPRQRVYPAKPKVGIRASRANEIWHVDTTLIRLLDGSRAYLHAVIDNFSRRILAWNVSGTFDPGITAKLLVRASSPLTKEKPQLLVDGGVENFNTAVDALVESGLVRRLLAMTEIAFSNSLIESWWRTLKHQWLYLNTLDSIGTLERLIAFYVDEHNTTLPHSAFRGETPDEMYFGTGQEITKQLEAGRKAARQSRLEANRKVSCHACQRPLDGQLQST